MCKIFIFIACKGLDHLKIYLLIGFCDCFHIYAGTIYPVNKLKNAVLFRKVKNDLFVADNTFITAVIPYIKPFSLSFVLCAQ